MKTYLTLLSGLIVTLCLVWPAPSAQRQEEDHSPGISSIQGELTALTVAENKTIVASQHSKDTSQGPPYRGPDRIFLENNAQQPGITVLPSGLQYRIERQGQGPQPKPGDTVVVHYRGRLVDGSVISNSYRDGQPKTYLLEDMIPGLQEGLQLMKEGAQWSLFLPYPLAFGEFGTFADKAVIYEIELIKVIPGDGA